MKYIFLLSIIILLTSCEEVIDIDLETSSPKLVVDASLNWERTTLGNHQEIVLSLTTPFFSEVPNPVTNAMVQVTNSNGQVVLFEQNDIPGTYETELFSPEVNELYSLTVSYENEVFEASTKLVPVVPIDFVEQTQRGGLSGQDFEIKPNYTDPANERNFYFYSFESEFSVFPVLEVYEDEFTNGNQVFAYYSEEELKVNDTVVIKAFGITERFYDFMFILLTQTNNEVGGPFETQPATLRGNIVNKTNGGNFPLGFFRASEVETRTYTIQ